MADLTRYYRICPVCGDLVGRDSIRNALAAHHNPTCLGTGIPWAELSVPTQDDLARMGSGRAVKPMTPKKEIEVIRARINRIMRYWDEREAKGGPVQGPMFNKDMSEVRRLEARQEALEARRKKP